MSHVPSPQAMNMHTAHLATHTRQSQQKFSFVGLTMLPNLSTMSSPEGRDTRDMPGILVGGSVLGVLSMFRVTFAGENRCHFILYYDS
jgi:hypothetical protein